MSNPLANILKSPDPTIVLQLNGKPLPEHLARRLLSWVYEDDNKMSKLTLRFDNHDAKMDFIKDLEPGKHIRFRHGYTDGYMSDPRYFIIMENSGWKEPIVEAIEIISLYNIGQNTYDWSGYTLTEVVTKIAAKNKLGVFVDPLLDEDKTPTILRVKQCGIEDMSFLFTLANVIGYEMYIDDGVLSCITRKNLMRPYMWFKYNGPKGRVIDFNPRVSIRNKRSKFEASGVDPKKPKLTASFHIIEAGTTNRGSYISKMTKNYDLMLSRYLTMKNGKKIMKPFVDAKDAQNQLAGKYIKNNQRMIEADLHLVGDPRLKRRRVIYVDGVSKYTGTYWVTNVTTSNDNGYVTVAHLERNAWFDTGFVDTTINPIERVNTGIPTEGRFTKEGKLIPFYFDRVLKIGKLK